MISCHDMYSAVSIKSIVPIQFAWSVPHPFLARPAGIQHHRQSAVTLPSAPALIHNPLHLLAAQPLLHAAKPHFTAEPGPPFSGCAAADHWFLTTGSSRLRFRLTFFFFVNLPLFFLKKPFFMLPLP